MAGKRKTISVADVVMTANHYLASSPNANSEQRWGTIGLVEAILHTTGNYNGFRYLPSELTTADQPHVERTTYLRIGYDDTRRRYNPPKGN